MTNTGSKITIRNKKSATAFSKRHFSMQPKAGSRRSHMAVSNSSPSKGFGEQPASDSLDSDRVEKLNLFGRPTYTKNQA